MSLCMILLIYFDNFFNCRYFFSIMICKYHLPVFFHCQNGSIISLKYRDIFRLTLKGSCDLKGKFSISFTSQFMPASGNTTPALMSGVLLPTISSSGSIAIGISERDAAEGLRTFKYYRQIFIFLIDPGNYFCLFN